MQHFTTTLSACRPRPMDAGKPPKEAALFDRGWQSATLTFMPCEKKYFCSGIQSFGSPHNRLTISARLKRARQSRTLPRPSKHFAAATVSAGQSPRLRLELIAGSSSSRSINRCP